MLSFIRRNQEGNLEILATLIGLDQELTLMEKQMRMLAELADRSPVVQGKVKTELVGSGLV